MCKLDRRTLYPVLILISIVLILAAFKGRNYSDDGDTIVISEVSGSDTKSYDENGNYARYVKVQNKSGLTMNLKGWGISDDVNKPYKFTFPSVRIKPGEVITVWRDEEAESDDEVLSEYEIRDIHAPDLPVKDTTVCILTDRSRRMVSRVDITGNEGIENEDMEKMAEPEFSVPGGWYEDEVKVEISAGTGRVYYTLDGSVPDENSVLYDSPITIRDRSNEENIWSSKTGISAINTYTPDFKVDKCTVLKAIAIEGDRVSPVKTETYFIGLKDPCYRDISTISISMDPEDLFGYERGIYVLGKVYDSHIAKYGKEDLYEYANYAKEGRGWEREAEIEYYPISHEKAFEQKIGIRIHGGYSTAYNQKSFNLYAREEYEKPGTFKYDVFKDTQGNGICNKLVLRSGGDHELYATKMRDVLLQSFMEGRDVGIQRALPCNVFLNGEYWGMYNLQETVGDCYIQEHYGTAEGNALIMKNLEVNKAGEEYVGEYYDMMTFAMENDLSDADNYRYMETLIDVQSCMDFYAAEIFCANADLYSNIAMWRAIKPQDDGYNDGRWRWLLYDLDESSGLITRLTGPEVDSFTGGVWGDSPPVGGDPLFSALLENESFREGFEKTFTEVAELNFDYGKTSAALKAKAKLYKASNIKSQQRFKGDFIDEAYEASLDYTSPYTEKDYSRDIDVLDDFLKKRTWYIMEYMKTDIGDYSRK